MYTIFVLELHPFLVFLNKLFLPIQTTKRTEEMFNIRFKGSWTKWNLLLIEGTLRGCKEKSQSSVSCNSMRCIYCQMDRQAL